ncbi:MAG: ribonuclease P protein component [Candidatus Babeliales bacterium]
MASVFHAMTSFRQNEVDALFKATIARYKIQGLEIRLAPKFLPLARLLIITPRACGNAPKRNRIRRRLKSIFYEHKYYEQPFDWIIMVKKEGIELNFDDLKGIMAQALSETSAKNA